MKSPLSRRYRRLGSPSPLNSIFHFYSSSPPWPEVCLNNSNQVIIFYFFKYHVYSASPKVASSEHHNSKESNKNNYNNTTLLQCFTQVWSKARFTTQNKTIIIYFNFTELHTFWPQGRITIQNKVMIIIKLTLLFFITSHLTGPKWGLAIQTTVIIKNENN